MVGVKPGIYRHYKGGLYQVISTCNLVKPRQYYKTNLNKLVLYKSYKNERSLDIETNQYWLRSMDVFLENITPIIPRFRFIGSDIAHNTQKNLDVVAFNTEEEIYYRAFRHMSFWFCYKL